MLVCFALVSAPGLAVEFHDSQKALEKIGQYHRLFTEPMEGKISINVEGLEDMAQRVYAEFAKKEGKSNDEPKQPTRKPSMDAVGATA